MKNNVLKIDKKFFDDIICGKKRFEIRYDNKKFKVGQIWTLQEVELIKQDIKCTERNINIEIECVFKNIYEFLIENDFINIDSRFKFCPDIKYVIFNFKIV